MIRLGDDGMPTNFSSFYFVNFAKGDISFFSALFQRLILNFSIFGLAILITFNKYIFLICCPVFWYGSYVFSINVFAFGVKYGFFNVFLYILALIIFLLIILVLTGFLLFDALCSKVYYHKFNIKLWLILLLAEAVIEIFVLYIVRYFVVIIA